MLLNIGTTHNITGEIIELQVGNLQQLTEAWKIASEYEKLAIRLKDQLKKILPEYLDESGKSEELDGYQFKTISVQRMNYDKAVMREVLDEDTLDVLLVPDKTAIDKFLKEAVERFEAGEISARLRDSMIPTGKPYSMTKLEKL